MDSQGAIRQINKEQTPLKARPCHKGQSKRLVKLKCEWDGLSIEQRLVRPDGKRESRIPGCKGEKAGGCDHYGMDGHAQAVPNQAVEQPCRKNGHGARAKGKAIGARGDNPRKPRRVVRLTGYDGL